MGEVDGDEGKGNMEARDSRVEEESGTLLVSGLAKSGWLADDKGEMPV